jgi:hypothetical protein
MKIIMYNEVKCGVRLRNDDGNEYEPNIEFSNLTSALEYCEEAIDGEGEVTFAEIFDVNTGDFLATCYSDSEEIAEEDYGAWDDWGYNEDMGFDPYLGCYTDDC